MGYKARYDKGDWVAICDSCGRKFKASHLKRRWDGLMTCSEDWEPRQTQDYVRGKAEKQIPVWTRSEASNTFADGESHTQTTYTNPNLTPVIRTVVELSTSLVELTGNGPSMVNISSDGLNLYTCNTTSDSISQFNIDQDTGLLTAKSPEVISGPSFSYFITSFLTSDDANYYVLGTSSIYQYSRNLSTGVLTELTPGSLALGLDPTAVGIDFVVTANGLFCYASVTTTTQALILIFSRNISTGQLTYLDSVTTDTAGILGITSTDTTLYLVSDTPGRIFQFGINTTTGALTELNPAYINLSNADLYTTSIGAIKVSPDNNFLYFVGTPPSFEVNVFLEVFAIAPNGTLSALPQLFIPISYDPALFPGGLVISQDGSFLSYVERVGVVSTLHLFSRNRLTGALTSLDQVSLGLPTRSYCSALTETGFLYTSVLVYGESTGALYCLSLNSELTEDILNTDDVSEVDASLGSFTINLPISPTSGETHIIKKVDTTNNVVTIYGNGNLINGYPVFELTKPYSGVCLEFTTTWTIKYTYPA